ncbi:MAG: metallophosphoesterase [Nitrospirae bacterium]|nr:metallophosphoesterase [Nitrospirota bacterium]
MMKRVNITIGGRMSLSAFVFLAGIYLFTGYAAAGVCSVNDDQQFSFIVFGDSRDNVAGVSQTLAKIVKTMAAHVDVDKPAPSFAVFTGDAATSGGRNNLKDWDNITSGLSAKIPVLFVKGNHDIYSRLKGYSRDGEFQEFQRERLEAGADINIGCIQRVPGEAGYSAFSFIWNGSLFVILDTYEVPVPKDQRNGWVSPRQLKMLGTALDNTTLRHKFVFAHTPAFDNGPHGNIGKPQYLGSWSQSFMEMWKIIDRNGVDTVFNAHDHFYARKKIDSTVNPQWKNGVLQVITGGAGAPLYDPESCAGSDCIKYDKASKINHFIIVTVRPEDASYKVYDLDDKQIEEHVINKP